MIGFDVAESKIDLLNKSLSAISTVNESKVIQYLKSGRIKYFHKSFIVINLSNPKKFIIFWEFP